MRGAALLLLVVIACRGDQAPGPQPVVDRAPVRDAGPVDAPRSVIAAAVDAVVPSTSPVPPPSGKRADSPAHTTGLRRKIDELRRAQDALVDPDPDAEERLRELDREYQERFFALEPDPFADAAPPLLKDHGAAISGGAD